MTEQSRAMELYKKYRPQSWGQLIGQEQVAKSLQNSVVKNSLPTAFLFSGPRGCGKTSAAFLLAKAINCTNSSGGNPCNECDVCINIDNNNQLGVTYLSMANKGTTEDIRELVKQARLSQPIKQQVFILDEIHTIHKQAFDALLIPIEDKTMPALFIFCTTEIDRVPDTLKSRLRKRKFKLVQAPQLSELLQQVTKQEDLEVPQATIDAAVKLSRGSVRQALSSLEELLDGEGEASNISLSEQLLHALCDKNISEALAVCAQANIVDVDFRDFAEQLFEDFRDILLFCLKVEPSLVSGIVFDPQTTKKFGVGLGGRSGLVGLMNEFADAATGITGGLDPRIRFELAVIKSVALLSKIEKTKASK